MDKNILFLVGTVFAVCTAFLIAIISEWFSPIRNMTKIWTFAGAGTFIIFLMLILVFRPLLIGVIMKLPERLGFVKKALVRFLQFTQTRLAKVIIFTVLLLVIVIQEQLIVRFVNALLIFTMFWLAVRDKKRLIPWAQGKRPKFQDGFNDDLEKWDLLNGKAEIETNFGNPAPDILLKQMGTQSTKPQTFLLLKDINLKRSTFVECDVYIEPRGIFNLVFGKTTVDDSYFMARLDSRETEFDALLFNSNGRGWNFVARSDKYRTIPKSWHRLKLEILSNKKVNFYKNGELIISRELDGNAFGQIGIMNEEADVHVDNFVITEI